MDSKKNVQLSDLELFDLLNKHQYGETLNTKEREDLWYFLNGWTRSVERRFFGKEDARDRLDIHHDRMLYVYDYFREYRYRTKGQYCELVDGVPKCKTAYYPDPNRPKLTPWQVLYRLRRYWARHESIIRLDGLGFDLNSVFNGSPEPFGRNKFELAATAPFMYDIITVMNYIRKTKDYNRDNIIEYALHESPSAKYTKAFRSSQAFRDKVGVIPFTDTFLRTIAQQKAYLDINELQDYTYLQLPEEEPWKIVQQLPDMKYSSDS